MSKSRKNSKTRLQRKREKDSLKQSLKYIFLILLLVFLMIRFGLPGLIKMATFIADITASDNPIEKVDTVAPMIPQLIPPPEATYSASLDIEGYGESGSVVELYLRGISVQDTVVDSEGSFKFKEVHLKDGKNQVYVTAKDDQGNISDQSETFSVLVDSQAPQVTIDSPVDGDRFFDSDSPIIVVGSSEYGDDLRINGRFVTVKNDGSFEMKLNLKDGDNEIKVIATDKASNSTTKSITVNYTP